jgi:hypothetical protein
MMATKFEVNIVLCCCIMAINMFPKWQFFCVMLSHFINCILKTQINIFFVIYLEMILMHAHRTFHILNFGSCIMKIDNIWRKLWLINIKRCFWQILKITVGMFCYMPEKHYKLTKWLLFCKTHFRSKFEISAHLCIHESDL